MASNVFPVIYLVRYRETAWSPNGRHTGRTDLPLTERGERNAERLRERLAKLAFAKVLTSPLQRAMRTRELAGFGAVAETDPDLVEWNYGDYEGLRTADIRAKRADWELFRDGGYQRRIAGRHSRAGGPCCHSRTRDQGHADFFQWTFFASARRSLAQSRTARRKIFHVRHSKFERAQL